MDKKLEEILKAHEVPPHSKNFASRIIMASEQIEQKQNIWKLLERLCREFSLPDPALSLASLLIMGFLVGFSVYGTSDAYAGDDSIIDQIVNNDEVL